MKHWWDGYEVALAILGFIAACGIFAFIDHLHSRWAWRTSVREVDAVMGIVEYHIDTEGLRVGSKLYNSTLGWVKIVRLEHGRPGKVWVRQERRP